MSTNLAMANVARVIRLSGDVEILTSQKPKGIFNNVRYDQKNYYAIKGKLGFKIFNNSIIHTKKGAKVRLIFKNGDQITVGPSTFKKISWTKGQTNQNSGTFIDLIYGSIRGVISEDGPRSNLKIKSKDALMGIRGTDFHVARIGTSGMTALSVIRGKVEMKSIKNKSIQIISKGQSGILRLNKKVLVNPTSKKDIKRIYSNSSIQPNKLTHLSSELKKEINLLEQAAVKSTLKDIKNYDQESYALLTKKGVKNVDQINKEVLKKALEKAPRKSKPILDELDLETSIYDQYYNLDN